MCSSPIPARLQDTGDQDAHTGSPITRPGCTDIPSHTTRNSWVRCEILPRYTALQTGTVPDCSRPHTHSKRTQLQTPTHTHNPQAKRGGSGTMLKKTYPHSLSPHTTITSWSRTMLARSIRIKGAVDHIFSGTGHFHGVMGMHTSTSWHDDVASAKKDPGLPIVPVP